MGLSLYDRLKAAAIIVALVVLFLSAFMGTQPQEASARANITAYTTTPPNTWEPKGFNVTGTAPWFVINTLGWNYTKTLGNVGLGNGSLRALNASGNRVINYTEQYTMAADISTAPYDPSRLTTVSVSGVNVEPESTSNITVQEFESDIGSRDRSTPSRNSSYIRPYLSTGGPNLIQPRSSGEPLCGDYPCTISNRVISKRDSANQPARALDKEDNASNATINTGMIGGNMQLNDPYHSILLGRPLDDMIYEHPHGIATNAYGRLMGLYLPGGTYANIGIRCLGYGY